MPRNSTEMRKNFIQILSLAIQILSNLEIVLYLKSVINFEKLKARHKRKMNYFISSFILLMYFPYLLSKQLESFLQEIRKPENRNISI